MAITKASVSLDSELLQTFKDFAKSRGMTFSGFVSVSCSTFMTQLKSYDLIDQMSEILARIKAGKTITEDDAKIIHQFEGLQLLSEQSKKI